MKYFFLALLLLCILVVGIFGFRGDIKTTRPIEIFPDMDVQDKIMGQSESPFFLDGQGSRLPVPGSVPQGIDDNIFPLEFSAGRSGYYYTGAIDDFYANGMPEELQLDADSMDGFLRRGKVQYDVHCAICHGASGDGKGITSYYGMAGIANLHVHGRETSPDGKIFGVITNGKGLMGSYGGKVTVSDRWAIIAYIRALQTAMKAPATAEAAASETPTASN